MDRPNAPFLGRPAPDARCGRSSEDREVGLIGLGNLAPSSLGSLECEFDEGAAPYQMVQLPPNNPENDVSAGGGPGRLGRVDVCSSVCLWPVLCSSAADTPPGSGAAYLHHRGLPNLPEEAPSPSLQLTLRRPHGTGLWPSLMLLPASQSPFVERSEPLGQACCAHHRALLFDEAPFPEKRRFQGRYPRVERAL